MTNIEQVAQAIYEASDEYADEGVEWEDQNGSSAREARRQAAAALAALAAYARCTTGTGGAER